MKLNPKLYFLLLSVALLIIMCISKLVINTDELLTSSLSDQMTQNQIKQIFEFNQKWEWVGYCALPVLLLIKIALISGVLYMGIFLFNKKLTYKKLFSIVTIAEFIFVFVAIIKLFWFSFQDGYKLEDVQYFYPLSALGLIGHQGLSQWYIYPFQMLNLFELVYWIVLAYFIGKEIKSTTDFSLKIVASSYGSAMLIWVVAVMFFTLNVS